MGNPVECDNFSYLCVPSHQYMAEFAHWICGTQIDAHIQFTDDTDELGERGLSYFYQTYTCL